MGSWTSGKSVAQVRAEHSTARPARARVALRTRQLFELRTVGQRRQKLFGPRARLILGSSHGIRPPRTHPAMRPRSPARTLRSGREALALRSRDLRSDPRPRPELDRSRRSMPRRLRTLPTRTPTKGTPTHESSTAPWRRSYTQRQSARTAFTTSTPRLAPLGPMSKTIGVPSAATAPVSVANVSS